MGYRYYDKKAMDVLFPFGHGLSYTTFEYTNLRLSDTEIDDTDTLTVTVTVKNTGRRFGKAVAQLYVGDVESDIIRPIRELKGYEKVGLNPGEAVDVTFTLDRRAFAYWNGQIHDWHVETGDFTIEVGASSRDLPLKATVKVNSTVRLPVHYDMDTILMDILKDPQAKQALAPLLQAIAQTFRPDDNDNTVANEAITDDMNMAMMNYMPLRGLLSFGDGQLSEDFIEDALNKIRNS